MTGLKEEIKGTIKRNPEEVQHGKDIVSGAEKRRARQADVSLSFLPTQFNSWHVLTLLALDEDRPFRKEH